MPLFGAATTTLREEVVVGGEGRTTRTRKKVELQLKYFMMIILPVIIKGSIKFELSDKVR